MRFSPFVRLIGSGLAAFALAAAVASTALAGGTHFNEKFEFDNVTFSDGTIGIIHAGSKLTSQGDQFTNCTYDTTDFAFLGQFGSDAFASTDADAVRDFCLEHFADRT
jgi:hypothetical protein